MKLARVSLKNFRCFDTLELDFNKQANVIVGSNGAGKTSVLDSMATMLESIAYGIS